MNETLTIVYLDDNSQLGGSALNKILDNYPYFKLLAHIYSGADTLKICPEIHPDVIIIDCNVPDMDLAELVTQLIEQCPTSSLITSSWTDSHHYLRAMTLAGVRYFASRPYTQDTVYSTLLHVARQRKQS